MSVSATLPIAVGIAGDDESALRFAVDEAMHTKSAIRLVHVVNRAMTMLPMSPLLANENLERLADRLLGDALSIVIDLSDDALHVEKAVGSGIVARSLVAESRTAQLLVMQHHRRASRVGRIVTASTSTAVAARAYCPVVSVPQTWSGSDRFNRVGVGLDEFGQPADVLRMALDAAQERAATLVVLHAWRLDAAYEGFAAAEGAAEAWRNHTRSPIEEVIDRVSDAYPGIKVTPELRYLPPAEALVELTRSCDLLVLGRRTRHGPLPIGSLARTLIRVGESPVMVVPVSDMAKHTA